jgi:hypothetical protein
MRFILAILIAGVLSLALSLPLIHVYTEYGVEGKLAGFVLALHTVMAFFLILILIQSV